MINAVSNFNERNSKLPSRDFNNTKTRINNSVNNVYYLGNSISHNNQISFQGGSKIPLSKTISKLGELLTDYFSKYIREITDNSKGLSAKQIKRLKAKLNRTQARNEQIETRILNLGRILDYDEMKKAGKTAEDIKTYVAEDTEAIKKAQEFTEKHLELQKHMFGYPANMGKDSFVTKHLRKKETDLYLMNSCGGPYQKGNYQMDSKEYEKEILSLFYKRFGVKFDPKAKDSGCFYNYILNGNFKYHKLKINCFSII